MARIKIGDIVEIKTSKGYAYAHYTHKHKQYGALLRVFKSLYPSKLESYDELFLGGYRFMNFFPLQAAVNQGGVEIVGNEVVPAEEKSFPVFRTGMVDPQTRKVPVWWLWDGEKEWKIGKLSPEQRSLPIRGVWNDTLLIERIESGWTPETDRT